MTKIALLGAGGKMGVRLASNLKGSDFTVCHVEVSEIGRDRLKKELDVECVDLEVALAGADVLVLAIPDNLIGTVANELAPKLESGTAIIMLDIAAMHAGEIEIREDITYFITHPCHPPIFNDEVDMKAKQDYFGAVAAKQHIVNCMAHGPEEHYAICESVAKTIYKPVMRSHRCTVEQMAILEPALSETVGATFCWALKQATEEATRRGVPAQVAEDFILGHMNILLSVSFGIVPGGRLSDGCMHAVEQAKSVVFQDNWLEKVFDPDAIMKSVQDICVSTQPGSRG